MTSPDARHPCLDAGVRLHRLLFAGAFALGVDTQRLILLTDFDPALAPRDRKLLQRLAVDVRRTARTYALLSDDAREVLGIARLTRRADVARGLADAAR